ncbi:MAG: hypothetical protein ACRYFZ_16380 [Janthinobacterium lividum]
MKHFYSKYWFISNLLIAVWLPKSLVAQVLNGYSFQAQAGTYTPLSGGTRLTTLEADEALDIAPLGFTFSVGGKFYTDILVSSNGWLCLGNPARSGAQPASSYFLQGGAGDWTAAPLWANLNGTGGQASYQTTGTAPNRVFTFEWQNWRWDQQAPQATISLQARLYESSNRIEFSYRPEAGAITISSPQAQAVIGVGSPQGGVAALTSAGVSPTLSTAPAGIATKPAAGQRYIFTPTVAAVCPAPQSVQLLTRRRTNVQVGWYNTNIGGTVFSVHYGRRGFIAGSADDMQAPVQPADTAQITGLQPNTNYEFYVEQNCGVGTPGRSARVAFSTYWVPFNDEGPQAQQLPIVTTPEQATPGTTYEATTSLPAGSCNAGTSVVRDVWYTFTPTAARHLVMLSAYGTAVEVRTGWSVGATSLGCSAAVGTSRQVLVDNLVVGRPYYLRVYSQLPGTGGTTFSVAVLETGAVPANDACASPTPLPSGQAYGATPLAGSLQFATNPGNIFLGSCSSSASSLPDIWYSFVAAANQEVHFTPAFDGKIEVLSTNCASPISAGQCISATANNPLHYRLQGLQSGTSYLMRVNRADLYHQPANQAFTLGLTQLPSAPANDNCAGALPLVLSAPAQAGTVAGATAGSPAPGTGCVGTGSTPPTAPEDVWYKFTAPATPVTVTLDSPFAAQLEVRPGTCSSLGASLACAITQPASANGAYVRQPAQVLLTTLAPGTEYFVRVFGLQSGQANDRNFTVRLAPAPAVPPNDEPANATPITISPLAGPLVGTVVGNIAGATPSLAGSTLPDIWYQFTVPTYPIALRVQSYVGVTIEIREGGPSYQLRVGLGGQPYVPPFPGFASLSLTPGQRYYVRVTPTGATTQAPFPDFSFTIAAGLLNDEPCGALPLPLSVAGQCTQPVVGTLSLASVSAVSKLAPAPNCMYGNNADVWYRFTATSPSLTIRSSDFMVKLLRVYEAPAICSVDPLLVGCQSVFNSTKTAIGAASFDNLVVGRDYLLAVSDNENGIVPVQDSFTLCAEAGTALTARPSAPAAPWQLWPNPVEAGQMLTVELPTGLATVQPEWLSAMGQRLSGASPLPVPVHNGQVQLPTSGRVPGLYLLRLWQPNGQPLPVRRVLIK